MSSHSSRSTAPISAYGVISAALTIAMSSPASTQWCSITELSTWRAAGLSPNDTFDTPSDVRTPGSSRLIRRMPSIVSTAESMYSASPVASVNVRSSKISAPSWMPYSPTTMSRMRFAISSLRCAVFAIPVSSMVSATTAAPASFTSGITESIFTRPFSRLTELTTGRPA